MTDAERFEAAKVAFGAKAPETLADYLLWERGMVEGILTSLVNIRRREAQSR